MHASRFLKGTVIIGALLLVVMITARVTTSVATPGSDSFATAGEASVTTPGTASMMAASATLLPVGSENEMHVYKTPTCGCCSAWVDHVHEHDFVTTVDDLESLDKIKNDLGVPLRLRSCHTAVVGGYVIEGHVPGDVIRQLLAEKPDVVGIAVPGMPLGSPGMEMADASLHVRYDIIAFDRAGNMRVFATR